MIQSKASSFLLPLLVAILGSYMLMAEIGEIQDQNLLRHTGVTWQARIEKTYYIRGWNRGYDAQYWFTLPSGQRYSNQGHIGRESYEDLKPGDQIEIRYAPSNPDISEITETSHPVLNMLLSAILGTIGLVLVLLMLILLFQQSKNFLRGSTQSGV